MFDPFDFPRLATEGYNKTSDATWGYNCIAHAASDTQRWWWPFGKANGKPAFWPKNVPKTVSLSAFSHAFKTKGYSICKDGTLEVGYEKIAIFVLNGLPEHAARQLPNGKWTHKMGPSIDFELTLAAVEGQKYGSAVRFMRRKLPKAPKPRKPKK